MECPKHKGVTWNKLRAGKNNVDDKKLGEKLRMPNYACKIVQLDITGMETLIAAHDPSIE